MYICTHIPGGVWFFVFRSQRPVSRDVYCTRTRNSANIQFSIFFFISFIQQTNNNSPHPFQHFLYLLNSKKNFITACAKELLFFDSLISDAGHRSSLLRSFSISFAALLFLQGTQLILHGIACTCLYIHFMSSNVDQYAHTLFCANVDLAPSGVAFLAS